MYTDFLFELSFLKHERSTFLCAWFNKIGTFVLGWVWWPADLLIN